MFGRKTKQKRPGLKRLVVWIPESLHESIMMRAKSSGRTATYLITQYIMKDKKNARTATDE
jgi:hypothetical protein